MFSFHLCFDLFKQLSGKFLKDLLHTYMAGITFDAVVPTLKELIV